MTSSGAAQSKLLTILWRNLRQARAILTRPTSAILTVKSGSSRMLLLLRLRCTCGHHSQSAHQHFMRWSRHCMQHAAGYWTADERLLNATRNPERLALRRPARQTGGRSQAQRWLSSKTEQHMRSHCISMPDTPAGPYAKVSPTVHSEYCEAIDPAFKYSRCSCCAVAPGHVPAAAPAPCRAHTSTSRSGWTPVRCAGCRPVQRYYLSA